MDLTQAILPASNLILAEIGIEPATVRSVRQAYQRTHYQAALNWLIRYTPDADNELTQVQGLLEAFHHLCTIDALQPASRLLRAYPKTCIARIAIQAQVRCSKAK